MRFLGFLFVLVLIAAAVGYFRGWFSVTTAHASERSEVTLGIDGEKIREDAQKLGELPEAVAKKVRSLGRKVGPEESEIDGNVTAIDLPARTVSMTSGSETIELRVPAAATITRDGEAIAFDRLRPTMRVRVRFRHAGEARLLSGIEILPDR